MADSRDKPELETLDYRPPKATKQSANAPPALMGLNSAVIKPELRANKAEGSPEQPNQNIMIIEEIEGLMSQVNDKLIKLSEGISIPNRAYILVALEEIDMFQKTTLFELRKAFE